MNTQPAFDVGEPALTTRLAARYLGISVSLLNKLRGTGQGPAVQVYGKRCVYMRSDLDAFAAAHRVAPTDAAPSNEGGEA